MRFIILVIDFLTYDLISLRTTIVFKTLDGSSPLSIVDPIIDSDLIPGLEKEESLRSVLRFSRMRSTPEQQTTR